MNIYILEGHLEWQTVSLSSSPPTWGKVGGQVYPVKMQNE